MSALTNAQRQRRFRERHFTGDLFPPFHPIASFEPLCSYCFDTCMVWIDDSQTYCTCSATREFLYGDEFNHSSFLTHDISFDDLPF